MFAAEPSGPQGRAAHTERVERSMPEAPLPLLTVAEVAQRLSIARATVYQWVELDPPKIPVLRFGRRCVRFRAEDVDRFVAESLRGSA